MKYLKAGFLTFCMMMGGSMMSQELNTYDGDGDNRLSQAEFEEVNKSIYYNYDDDADGNITNEEFYRASYREFDSNGDGNINQEEWNTGIGNNAGSFGNEDFTTFDSDADGALNEDEWNDGMSRSNEWYETFDLNQDGNITSEEWNESNFEQWDADKNSFIDEEEFEMNNRNW